MNYLKKTTMSCLVLSKNITIEDAKAASLIENMHRKGMNNKDISTAINYLLQSIKSKSKVATMLGMDSRTLRRYMAFDAIPGQIKELVPDTISRDEAVKIYKIIVNVKNTIEIIKKISKLEKNIRVKYIQELAKDHTTPHKTILNRIKNNNINNANIKLSKSQSSFITKESKKQKIKPEILINKLIQLGIKHSR